MSFEKDPPRPNRDLEYELNASGKDFGDDLDAIQRAFYPWVKSYEIYDVFNEPPAEVAARFAAFVLYQYKAGRIRTEQARAAARTGKNHLIFEMRSDRFKTDRGDIELSPPVEHSNDVQNAAWPGESVSFTLTTPEPTTVIEFRNTNPERPEDPEPPQDPALPTVDVADIQTDRRFEIGVTSDGENMAVGPLPGFGDDRGPVLLTPGKSHEFDVSDPAGGITTINIRNFNIPGLDGEKPAPKCPICGDDTRALTFSYSPVPGGDPESYVCSQVCWNEAFNRGRRDIGNRPPPTFEEIRGPLKTEETTRPRKCDNCGGWIVGPAVLDAINTFCQSECAIEFRKDYGPATPAAELTPADPTPQKFECDGVFDYTPTPKACDPEDPRHSDPLPADPAEGLTSPVVCQNCGNWLEADFAFYLTRPGGQSPTVLCSTRCADATLNSWAK
jgi:hypothetical protein